VKKNRRRRARTLVLALRQALRLSFTAVVLGAGAFAGLRGAEWVRAHPYFSVREIDVESRGRIDAQTIVAWAGLAPGMSVWSASDRDAENRLLAHPRIRQASVERRFPGQVKVHVEERLPVAVLFANEPLLVASDGVTFPPLPGEAIGDLPYITGLAGKDPRSSPVAARLRESARLAVAWRERGQWPTISEIRPGDDELLVYVAGTPLAIRFAAEARNEDLARLAVVLELWRGREVQVAAIDLSLPGEAVLTMRTRKAAPPPAMRADLSPTGRGKAVAGKTLI
jgi:cell division protein FtsQ